MRKRVAICGGLRAGKSEASSYLSTYYNFERESFGADLKRTFHEMFPDVPPNPKPVSDYVWWGQTLRERDPDVWVKRVDARVNARFVDMYFGRHIVIDDLRQPNEYDWCVANGFTIVRINADPGARLSRAMKTDVISEENLTKPTELHFDTFDVDYELYNDWDIAHLYSQLDDVMEALGIEKQRIDPSPDFR